MTTAQVFADYLWLTEESAPWAYGFACPLCGDLPVFTSNGVEAYECGACFAGFREPERILTATSPLAPSPTPGWLETLVQASCGLVFFGPTRGDDGCVARMDGGLSADGLSAHPTHAVALAMLAADPDLRAACAACEDWDNYKEIVK